MKPLWLILGILLFPAVLSAQNNPDYDPELARKLGADERGMKMYILVVLKSGPNNERDSVKRSALFAGHFRNMNSLAGQGKLIVAGPIDDNEQSYRGIFILDVQDPKEAEKLLAGDPTIREKIFEPLYFRWYGSAALPEYLKADSRIRRNLP